MYSSTVIPQSWEANRRAPVPACFIYSGVKGRRHRSQGSASPSFSSSLGGSTTVCVLTSYTLLMLPTCLTHSSIFEDRHAFPPSPLESPAFLRHHVKADDFRTAERYVESVSAIHSRTCLSIGPFVPLPSTSRHISRPGN